MAKTQKKTQNPNTSNTEIEAQLNSYIKSFEQLKITMIKVEGAIEALQNMLNPVTDKESK